MFDARRVPSGPQVRIPPTAILFSLIFQPNSFFIAMLTLISP